ncbi:MAG TPA: response regulator transcription factor [Steroidobacteraceae bacterium]|nr:response regulator transcription factor [Steroidobacteraceae bacterium]
MSARLLMVEDERNVAETLMERLRSAGYEVVRAESVLAARRAIAEGGAFQLALLDVGLPDGNGFELARLLRERAPATAIIFLTAHASPEDRVRGLELGADDYMGKPFHFRELLLRVQNCLKRAQDLAQVPGEMRQVHIGRALVDFERFCATVDGETHSLTHKECSVLRLLAERVGKAVSRDEILDRAWSADEFPTSRTVDNFIVRLRKLVEADPADPRVIRSIRGVGYLLTELHRE